jgi:hypothetical protein
MDLGKRITDSLLKDGRLQIFISGAQIFAHILRSWGVM